MAQMLRVTEATEGTRREVALVAALRGLGTAFLMCREWGKAEHEHYHVLVYTELPRDQLVAKLKEGVPGLNQKTFSCKKAPTPSRAEQYICKGPRANAAKGDARGDREIIVAKYGVQFTADYLTEKHFAYWAESSKSRKAAKVAPQSFLRKCYEEARKLRDPTIKSVIRTVHRMGHREWRSDWKQWGSIGKLVFAKLCPEYDKQLFGEILSAEGLYHLIDPPDAYHLPEAREGPCQACETQDELSSVNDSWEPCEHDHSCVHQEAGSEYDCGSSGLCPVPELHTDSVCECDQLVRVQCVVRSVCDRQGEGAILAEGGPGRSDRDNGHCTQALLVSRSGRPESSEPERHEGTQQQQDCSAAHGSSSNDLGQAECTQLSVSRSGNEQLRTQVQPVAGHVRNRRRSLRDQVQHRRSDHHSVQGRCGDNLLLQVQEHAVSGVTLPRSERPTSELCGSHERANVRLPLSWDPQNSAEGCCPVVGMPPPAARV